VKVNNKLKSLGLAQVHIEEYDTTEKETITLYAREEDGFEDPENVFTDKQELLDWYAEDEDEADE
jgi:hypothetical protein